ncbi:MAG: hypothetical protein ACYTER_03290 [Planctomycetota bacterium]
MSAWPCSMAELEKVKHINELAASKTITGNIDYRQAGISVTR